MTKLTPRLLEMCGDVLMSHTRRGSSCRATTLILSKSPIPLARSSHGILSSRRCRTHGRHLPTPKCCNIRRRSHILPEPCARSALLACPPVRRPSGRRRVFETMISVISKITRVMLQLFSGLLGCFVHVHHPALHDDVESRSQFGLGEPHS